MKYLAVKDFAKFQHYRDRNPPWIKLYATVLTDAAFLQMSEAAQAQLVKLWILASQFGHPLPNNPKLLAGKIGTTGKFHLASIIAAGFLVPCEHDASSALASSKQDAMPSVRVRAREESSELELSVTPAEAEGEAGLAVLLESDSDRTALTAVVARAGHRGACIATLRAMLTGNDPAVRLRPSPAQFGQALRDYVSNGNEWNAAHFRGYIKRATTPEPVRPSSPAARGANGAHDHATGAGRGALLFGKLRTLVREQRPPGQSVVRSIRKADVVALGEDVLTAYEAIGGAERVIGVTSENVSFAIRDFTNALDAVEQGNHVHV